MRFFGGKKRTRPSNQNVDKSFLNNAPSVRRSGVRFKEKVNLPTVGLPGEDQYDVYEADSMAAAKAFLRTQNPKRTRYYIVVETPEGVFGKDCMGEYEPSPGWRGY